MKNSKVRHASVGAGNMAWNDISGFRDHKDIEMVAFCDVDSEMLKKAKERFPQARFYSDWREMLAKEADNIDSVNISIPDHNHTVVADAFMRAGKHVYLQKPLCRTLAECKHLRELAAETGVVTQMGTQFIVSRADRQVQALIESRAVGPVEKAIFFSTRKGLTRFRRYMPEPTTPPSTLDWDGWLGVAPKRPYGEKLYHPLTWRLWQDFGTGWLGDIACHLMGCVWLGMKLGSEAPNAVWAEAECDAEDNVKNIVWPSAAHIRFFFDGVEASGNKPFEFEWFDGISEGDNIAPEIYRPSKETDELFVKAGFDGRPLEGKAIRCRDGWILQSHAWQGAECKVLRDDGKETVIPEMPEVPTHYHEFIDRCIDGGKARADFSWATYMMDAILIGGISERVPGVMLHWDKASRTFDNPDANRII